MNAATTALPAERRLATSALTLGILSLVLLGVLFPILGGFTTPIFAAAAGLAAIICGSIALRRRQPGGLAITGIVLGGLGLLGATGLVVFALIFVGAWQIAA